MQRVFFHLLGTLALVPGSWLVHAQEYPSKTINLVVPAAPGGSLDALARLLADAMGKVLKQQIVVENIGGAGTTIGTARVARSPGDGYTILINNVGQSIVPSLYRQLPYNVITDFEPIGLVADLPMSVVARKDLPAKDFKEMLAYIKTRKEKVSWANAGLGSSTHLCGLLFMNAIGIDLTAVPYKGGGPALIDLAGGHVDFLCDMTASTLGHIKAGTIKAYGVTSKTRVASLPDVPTLNEAGLPGFEIVVWNGLWVPKGTPLPVIGKLSAALQQALTSPLIKQRFAEFGTELVPQDQATPEALRVRLKSEIDKWGPIVKKAGVYAN